ncbi:MAG: Crp/Fnr family transcriptional regulator [Tissierellia bacterium]|nr:Crp/Fnr family transcriptional regulator [Tissierellia bacterium]
MNTNQFPDSSTLGTTCNENYELDEQFWDRLIFRNISPKSKKAIEEMDKTICSYSANELIIREGEPIDHICVIISGVLKSTEYTAEGKELNSSYFFGGDIIPGGDAFPFYLVYGGEKNYFFNTYCFIKARAVWLPVKYLLPVIEKDPIFLHNVLVFVSEYSRYSRAMLRCVQYRKVFDRIAFWLIHVNAGNTTIRIPHSQGVLADMLHVNRSTLNQSLKVMEQEGLIRVDGREIHILEEERLATHI